MSSDEIIKEKKQKKIKKDRKDKTQKKHPKLKKILLRIFIALLIIGVISVGVLLGVIYGLIKGEWSLTEEDLAIEFANSTVVDLNGNVIGMLNSTVSTESSQNRIIISKDEMSPYLEQAFISIEDERFEEHHGVDLKRTLGATLNFITHKGSSSYGGSTITQQCVKNLTGEDDSTGINGVIRKIKEMARAYQLNKIWSRDQIIELYLNLIPLGGDIYGVETASRKYFNKNAKDLTVVEAAYLAGITNAPSTYNPFGSAPYGEDEAKTNRINKRVTDVCYKMNELGRLSDEDYNAALEEIKAGIKFEEGRVSENSNLSYHTEAAVEQIIKDLMKEKGWTRTEAEVHVYAGGYTIYTTQDTELQTEVEKAYTNSKWIAKKSYTVKDDEGKNVRKTEQIQSAMVIIDHSKGYVVAGAGALGEKTARGLNRMTVAGRQPGSSIKPIAVIGPSLEEGLINAGTVIDDTPVSYKGNPAYTPKNDTRNYYGLMNIRDILKVSRNIPEVKMMSKLTVNKSVEYLKALGVTTVEAENEGLSLALGGATRGISPLEMAGAYATIANYGVYIEPTFYTEVKKSNGETVIKKQQETHRVFSEQNAWILQSLLVEPTGRGMATTSHGATASSAVLSGYQTCGKTGTTDEKTSTWFCGFTPYYTASMYFGYDYQKLASDPGSGTVASRWASIMKIAHKDLPSAKFERPSGITTASICTKSGLLAGDLCKEAGTVYTEYFVNGTTPKSYCSTHVDAMVCSDTGLLAGENCPNPVRKIFISRESRNSGWESAEDAGRVVPVDYCTHEGLGNVPSTETPTTPPEGETPTTPPEGETQTTPGTQSGENPSTPDSSKPSDANTTPDAGNTSTNSGDTATGNTTGGTT